MLTEAELRERYTEIRGDSTLLKIGVQSFTVYQWDSDPDEDQREWYRDMLAKALFNLQVELKLEGNKAQASASPKEIPSGPCPDCGRDLGEDPRARPIGAPQCLNPEH